MLNQHKIKQLEALKNRATRYEVVNESPDGQRYLVGYTVRPSRSGLLAIARNRADEVIARTKFGDEHRMSFRGKGRLRIELHLGNGWIIKFSGRTQRDAIIGGELEHV